MYSGRVRRCSSLTATTGQRNSFHALRKVITASTASTGRDRGSTTNQNIRNSRAPSMRAASMRSFGMSTRNCRTRKIPQGLTTKGSMSAKYELMSPRRFIWRKSGITTTCMGIMMPMMMIRRIVFLNLNRYFASA